MARVGEHSEIHLFHHTYRKTGGKERYGIALVNALARLGCEVTVHAVRGDPELARQTGAQLNLLSCPAWPRKLQPYWFFRRVEKLRRNLGGIHLALSRVQVKDVLISGGTHLAYLERGRKWAGPFDRLQVWLERQAYQAPAHIVAHSDLIASELAMKYGVPGHRLTTLYAPVDDRFRRPVGEDARAEIRRKLGWPVGKVVFLFPSSGHSRKGLEPITEALAGVADDVILAVAGRPTGTRFPFVRSLGYVEDMAAAYRAADFTILGSYYEPFGLVGPESVLCGTRLVFEREIGCLSAIHPEYVHSFSVWDPASIRQAVTTALAQARRGEHRVADPEKALRYDPSAEKHAHAVLELARRPPLRA